MPQPAAVYDAGPSRPRRDSAPTTAASVSAAIAASERQHAAGNVATSQSQSQALSRTGSSQASALAASGTPVQRRPTSPTNAMSRPASPTPHLDLALYPTPRLLKLLASLLQRIASENDALRAAEEEEPEAVEDRDSASGASESRSRSSVHPSPTTALFHDDPPPDLANGDPLFTASRVSLSHPSSILSFHARHVPSISIEAYLLRILKYCPTTNEVFLGLLVYFDRMSRLGTTAGVGGTIAAVGPRGFSIDSYNIHRLIIAGVTVASKFFSDVFYTNSRYAKVGGLPPHELNQLELQFLLLNNFTLMIPPEEMQSYGDRLLAWWQGREEAVPAEGTSVTGASGGRGAAPASTLSPQDEVARLRARERQAREAREREREREKERERSRDRAREEMEASRRERERAERERAERERGSGSRGGSGRGERRERSAAASGDRAERQASSAPMDVDEHRYAIERQAPSPAPTPAAVGVGQ